MKYYRSSNSKINLEDITKFLCLSRKTLLENVENVENIEDERKKRIYLITDANTKFTKNAEVYDKCYLKYFIPYSELEQYIIKGDFRSNISQLQVTGQLTVIDLFQAVNQLPEIIFKEDQPIIFFEDDELPVINQVPVLIFEEDQPVLIFEEDQPVLIFEEDQPVLIFEEDQPVLVFKEDNQCKYSLRKYQEDAYNCILSKNNSESKICLPCGTGKSFLYIKYIEDHINEKILILVPTRNLLEQTYNYILEYNKIESVKIGTGYNDYVTDDFKKNNKIFVSVYNSCHLLKDVDFDCIFVDEAQHIIYIFQKFIKIYLMIKKMVSFVIINSLIFKRKILMSATLNDADYEYTILDAINDGYICDYDINIPVFKSDSKSDSKISFLNGIAKYIYDNPRYQHCISYSNRRTIAKKFCDIFNDILPGSCEYIDGNTNTKEREKILKDFECGKIRIISNVNVISEGTNLNICDSVIFIDKTDSNIKVIQRFGRCLRNHETKIISHVIIPTTDDDMNVMKKFIQQIGSYDNRIFNSITSKRYRRINIDIEETEDESIRDLLYESIYNNIGTCLFGQFDYKIKLCLEYEKTNGKIINTTIDNNGNKLGIWLKNQRQRYKNYLHDLNCDVTTINNVSAMTTHEIDKLCQISSFNTWYIKFNRTLKSLMIKF